MPSLIQKAYTSIASTIRKASRGSLSDYVLNSPAEYGQPRVIPGDADGLITPQRMREVIRRTPTAGAALNAIIDYCSNVNILAKNVDASLPADPKRLKIVEEFLSSPNDNDTRRHFLNALVFDLAVLGFAAVEVEMNASGKPANLYVLDGARVTIDYDEHGTVLGYDMLDAHGKPIRGKDGVHAWMPDEIIFFRRDTVSESIYPLSRIQQLFACAYMEDLMIQFISGKFTESNIPYGIYDLGEISDMELKQAITHWNDQANSNHKILLTGSRGKSTWTQFGYALKDLEATHLLNEMRAKIMGILGVTANELGESQDINKSNGYNLSYTFKRRAIEPILNEICGTLNAKLIKRMLKFDDIEYYYEDIDSRDELLQAQIDDIYLKQGIYSPNHVANRKGLPSVDGGDDRFMILGTSAVPMDLVRKFAEAQLAAVQAEVVAIGMGGAGGVTPPVTRAPAIPGKTNTPDGNGSSEFRMTYPKNNNPQAARGPVQASRNAGQRKEEMTG